MEGSHDGEKVRFSPFLHGLWIKMGVTYRFYQLYLT
jgi:hypothetical protein